MEWHPEPSQNKIERETEATLRESVHVINHSLMKCREDLRLAKDQLDGSAPPENPEQSLAGCADGLSRMIADTGRLVAEVSVLANGIGSRI